jgi:hypothetical protein
MAAPKGHKRWGGRTKGTPNKITRELGAMIDGALMELGGQQWLVRAAKKKPEAFMGLLGKRLPKDVRIGGGLKLSVNLYRDGRPTDS